MKERLKELRIKNNYSQKELADKLYVTQQTVSKWESTDTTPELDLIVKLSKLYNVSMDYITTGSTTSHNLDDKFITVYSFDDTEENVLNNRNKRKLGAIIGLLFSAIFIILNIIVNKELSLFGAIIFVIFFFSLRDCTISNNANFDVPENRYKEALMNKSSIAIACSQTLAPILIILNYISNIFYKHSILPTVVLTVGVCIGGILIRSFKLYSSNKVRKEQKKLSLCKEVTFNKKHNKFDVIGRVVCVGLLITSFFISDLSFETNFIEVKVENISSTQMNYTYTFTKDYEVDLWEFGVSGKDIKFYINNVLHSSNESFGGFSTSLNLRDLDFEKGDVCLVIITSSGDPFSNIGLSRCRINGIDI